MTASWPRTIAGIVKGDQRHTTGISFNMFTIYILPSCQTDCNFLSRFSEGGLAYPISYFLMNLHEDFDEKLVGSDLESDLRTLFWYH